MSSEECYCVLFSTYFWSSCATGKLRCIHNFYKVAYIRYDALRVIEQMKFNILKCNINVLKWSVIQKVDSILLADGSDTVLQHNMDIIKVECDPDIEAHAVSLGGKSLKQNLKEELSEDPVSISTQKSEVGKECNWISE